MANYFSDKVILNPITGINTVEPKYIEDDDITTIATVLVGPNLVLAAGDTIQLLDVPALCRFSGAQMDTAKLDSGTVLTINVGDALNAVRIFAAAPVGQLGGYVGVPNTNGILGYTFPTVTRIFATVAAGAAGGTVGTKSFVFALTYNADA